MCTGDVVALLHSRIDILDHFGYWKRKSECGDV